MDGSPFMFGNLNLAGFSQASSSSVFTGPNLLHNVSTSSFQQTPSLLPTNQTSNPTTTVSSQQPQVNNVVNNPVPSTNSSKQSNFMCPLCGRCYAYRHGLSQHMQSHLGQKPFTCNECGKAFGRKFQLDRHTKVHLKVHQTYQCKDCGEVFHMRESFLLHMKTHSRPDETPFLCESCGAAFTSKSALVQHRRKFHPGQSLARLAPAALSLQQTPTQVNNASYVATAALFSPNGVVETKSVTSITCQQQQSQITVTTPPLNGCSNFIFTGPFPCFVCGKRFLDRYGLKRHFRCHSGERPHVCNICNQSFVEASHMKQHMKTHSNETPFQCIICSRGFNRKYSYQRHLKWHAKSTMPPAAITPEQLHQALLLSGIKIDNILLSNDSSATPMSQALNTPNGSDSLPSMNASFTMPINFTNGSSTS